MAFVVNPWNCKPRDVSVNAGGSNGGFDLVLPPEEQEVVFTLAIPPLIRVTEVLIDDEVWVLEHRGSYALNVDELLVEDGDLSLLALQHVGNKLTSYFVILNPDGSLHGKKFLGAAVADLGHGSVINLVGENLPADVVEVLEGGNLVPWKVLENIL